MESTFQSSVLVTIEKDFGMWYYTLIFFLQSNDKYLNICVSKITSFGMVLGWIRFYTTNFGMKIKRHAKFVVKSFYSFIKRQMDFWLLTKQTNSIA